MVISLFITCYNDTLFPETGKAVVSVLERLGHTVDFRSAQTCCGQMHYNSGYAGDAVALMRHFVDVFRGAEVICIPSSSCVAMIREYYRRMADEAGDADLRREVADLVPRVFEFTELLVDRLGVTDVGATFERAVTLHTSCHAIRALGIRDQPVKLLRAVRGLTLVDLPRAEDCCGFGGLFALKNADVSSAMLGEKMDQVVRTGADVCTGTDNSCLMHIGGGLERRNAGVTCLHVAEILASTDGGPRR